MAVWNRSFAGLGSIAPTYAIIEETRAPCGPVVTLEPSMLFES